MHAQRGWPNQCWSAVWSWGVAAVAHVETAPVIRTVKQA
jgi:hypothetical protein